MDILIQNKILKTFKLVDLYTGLVSVEPSLSQLSFEDIVSYDLDEDQSYIRIEYAPTKVSDTTTVGIILKLPKDDMLKSFKALLHQDLGDLEASDLTNYVINQEEGTISFTIIKDSE